MATRNLLPMQQKHNRVVVLVDMDCFYCQVEEKLDPTLKGEPLAVVQYNAWRGGGIIAVNYAARAQGVTRHMRGEDAQLQCPDIKLVKVPSVRDKADLTKYREAGKEVANVLQRFTPLLERASVDEAYLDMTEEVNKRLGDMNAGSFLLNSEALINSYAVGFGDIGDFVNTISMRLEQPNHVTDNELNVFAQAHDTIDVAAMQQSDLRLLIGTAIAGEVRAAVKAETGYECSAGIAHNKLLAKLACGINKPNKQTVLPLAQIPVLFDTLPVGKITGLGGKFGEEICQRLDVRFMGQVLRFTESELQRKFDEKNGTWLYNICRGVDLEAVTPRFYSKSIGCCKKFPGRNNITGLNTLKHWLSELANEVCERLEKDVIENNRRAKQMVVSFVQDFDGQEISSSRSAPLSGYDAEILAKSSFEVLQTHTKQFYRAGSTTILNNAIRFLGISVGKFETILSGQSKLQVMFANQAAKKKRAVEAAAADVEEEVSKAKVCATTHTKKLEEKKPTFLQNYLKNKKSIEDQQNQAKLQCSSNIDQQIEPELFSDPVVDVNHAETTADKLEQQEQELFDTELFSDPSDVINKSKTIAKKLEPPEKKSFFSVALKSLKQEAATAKSETAASSNVNQQEASLARKPKGFFAKMLSKMAIETVNEIENAQVIAVADNKPIQSAADVDVEALPQRECDLKVDDNNVENIIDAVHQIADTEATKKRKYANLSEIETHEETLPIKRAVPTTYQTSYAEFAVPELRQEYLQYMKCEQCGADVPADERSQQMHQDHHLAKEMSQQMREEYRTQVKSHVTVNKTSTAAPNKKQKKSPNNAAAKANITKFLKPKEIATLPLPIPTASTSAAAAAEALSNTETVACTECQQLVALCDLAEHKDFHVAKELQRKLNLLEVRTVAVVKKKSTAATANLNSSQSSRTLNASIKNTKPITQFFSQTNY